MVKIALKESSFTGKIRQSTKIFLDIIIVEGSIYHFNPVTGSKSESASCNRSAYLSIFKGGPHTLTALSLECEREGMCRGCAKVFPTRYHMILSKFFFKNSIFSPPPPPPGRQATGGKILSLKISATIF